MNEFMMQRNGGGGEAARLSPSQSKVVGNLLLASFASGLAVAGFVGVGTAITIGGAYLLFFKKRNGKRR